MEVSIREAKNKLSSLIEAAGRGEEIHVTKRGTRVARLMPPAKTPDKRRGRGCMVGKVNLYEGWDSPEEDKKIEDMFEFLKEEE